MSIADIEFLSPGFLYLLPLLGMAWFIWQRAASRRKRTGIQVNSLLSPSSDLRVRHPLLTILVSRLPSQDKFNKYDTIITWIVIALLVLALAGPVRTGTQIPDPPEQRDITFIVDTSVSMLLRDYILDGQRIDRMSFLKGFLDRFVQQLEGDRISVIVFGDSAYTLLPLNEDLSLTRRMMARIKTTMAGRFNALGEAISLGVKESIQRPDRRRVLVLFSDADTSTDYISPIAAAELAREAGLPLYTIAIGASTYDAAENELAGLIYHPANITLLQDLAELTGAKSYQAGDVKTLDEAIKDIELREKYKKEIVPRYFIIPLFPIPLIAGLLILSLYQFFRLGWSATR